MKNYMLSFVFFGAMGTIFIVLISLIGGIFMAEHSRYSYCKSKDVPYGICSHYLREEFATQNIKLRIK